MTMLLRLTPLLLLVFCAPPPAPTAATSDHVFEGVVSINPASTAKHTFHRVNRFLLDTASGQYELYTSGHDERVKPFVGNRVRVTGRVVETDVEGAKHRELWVDDIRSVPSD